MVYTQSYQLYKYEHGLTAAEQRAADIHAGQVAAELKNLGRCLGRPFGLLRRAVPGRPPAGAVSAPGRALPSGL